MKNQPSSQACFFLRFPFSVQFLLVGCCLLFLPLLSFSQINANFSANTTSGCGPLTVQFNDQSTGGVVAWDWDFGDGGTSTQQNPSHIYTNSGNFTVTLIVTGGGGADTLVRTAFIQVFDDPIADFTFGNPTGCRPWTVSFTDLSQPGSGSIAGWTWDFGDGNISNQANPTHTYTTAGTFTVSLTVINSFGCDDVFVATQQITVHAPPVPAFTASPTSACNPPLTVNFTNQTPGNNTYTWDFGDNSTSTQTSPTHTYTQSGVYDVRLIAVDSNGCSDTLLMPGFIQIAGQSARFSMTDSLLCEGDSLIFGDLSNPVPVAWNWRFGDGGTDTVQNPAYAYSTAGTYSVTLVVDLPNGCKDSITRTNVITVFQQPTAMFAVDTLNSCTAPHTVNLTPAMISGSGVTYAWDFGNGTTGTMSNPTVTYTQFGIYPISLIVTGAGGCVDTFFQTVSVSRPSASFVGDTLFGCVPLTVNFTDQSQSLSSNVVSWFWDFGDGGTDTVRNPTHTYTQAGLYAVTLIIENAEGCRDTTVISNYVQAGLTPIANFSANPLIICPWETIVFSDSSINAVNYFWDFGDGNNSTLINPTHQYQDTGSYTITLIVSNNGCFDTLVKPRYIRVQPPIARFTWSPMPPCEGADSIRLLNLSQGGTDFTWIISGLGGATYTGVRDTVHYFPGNGLYQVTLIAFDSTTGCTDSLSQQIVVTSPTVGFTSQNTTGCTPLTVTFTDTSNAQVNDWFWVFGDGQVSTQQNPVHTYTRPGIFTVVLRIETVWGCILEERKTMHVRAFGTALSWTTSPNPGCLSDSILFMNTSLAPAGIASWQWDFGDGTGSSLQSPRHQYTLPGTYDVSLIAVDSFGCRDTLLKPEDITVSQVNAAWTGDTIRCIGDSIAFTSLTQGDSLNIFWVFGDGDSSTVLNPVHLYDTLGSYPLQYIVEDTIGCRKVLPQTIHIVDPIADFSANPAVGSCPPMLVQFTNLSTWDIGSWEWDFGDGATSALPNPAHVYTQPGNYDVRLIVNSLGGCSDTIFFPQLVRLTGPTGQFSFQPQTGCQPLEVSFSGTAQDAGLYTWGFGDGTVQTGGLNVTHQYDSSGVFYPVLIVEDSLGCRVPIRTPDSIVVHPRVRVNFTGGPLVICGTPDSVRFTDLSQTQGTIVSWLWDFGDGISSTLQNPVHQYFQYGVYDVRLITETSEGCRDTLVRPGYVRYYPGPQAAFGFSNPGGTPPYPVQFLDSSQSALPIQQWQWSFGDGTGALIQNPSHVYGTCGMYPVKLIVTDSAGCQDSVTRILDPYPRPVVTAGPDTAFCKGGKGVGLSAVVSGAGGPYYYTWWCDSTHTWCGLDSINDNDPQALPDTSTWYYVQVFDQVGCPSNIDSVFVTVKPLPVVDAGRDVWTCPPPGPGVQLSATASNAPGPFTWLWVPGTGLNDSTIPNPYARPDTTTIYTVFATSTNGCTSNSTTLDTLSTVTVHVRPLPIAEAGPDLDLCPGDLDILKGFGYGAGPGYHYQWSPATGLSDSSIATPTVSPPFTTQYILTVWSNGCPSYGDTVIVNVHTNPTANAGPDREVCLRDSIGLDGQASGDSTATYSWNWVPTLGLSDPQAENPLASPPQTTTYALVATSNWGCESMADSVLVKVMPTPQAEAGPPLTICSGDTIALQGGYFYDGTDSAEVSEIYFSWSPGQNMNDTTLSQPSVWPSGTEWYYLNVYHNTCVTRDSVQLTVVPEIFASAAVDTAVICSGDSVLLSGAGGQGNASFNWFPATAVGRPGIAVTRAAPDDTTLFGVVVAEGGCLDTAYVQVNVIPNPDVAIETSIREGCAPLTVHFLDVSANTVQRIWDFGDGSPLSNTRNPVHVYPNPGRYTVQLIGVNLGACQDSISGLEILVSDTIQANFDTDPLLPAERFPGEALVQVRDLSPGAISWWWDFGDGLFGSEPESVHQYFEPGEYWISLIVENQYGCRGRIRKGPLIVLPPELYIPNVFTPNGDGNEDLYRVLYEGPGTFELEIFDRWGQRMFITNVAGGGWDGRHPDGEPAPEGVYYYKVLAGGKEYAGHLTLLR